MHNGNLLILILLFYYEILSYKDQSVWCNTQKFTLLRYVFHCILCAEKTPLLYEKCDEYCLLVCIYC